MLSEAEQFLLNVSGGGQSQRSTWGECKTYMGTVGWDEVDEHAYLGGDSEDGHSLVRVTLYAGRNFSEDHKPDIAQGHQVVCHIGSSLFNIPPKGTRCIVVIPEGMEHIPAAGCIIETIGRSPPDQLGKDRTVMDFGADTHVIIKGKSVSLSSHDDEFITVGTPRSGGTSGLLFQAKDGTGGVINEGVVGWFVAASGDAKTLIQMTPDKIAVMNKSGGSCVVLDQNFTVSGSAGYITCGRTYIGTIPTALTPALHGITGVAGVASTSVFLSP